PAGGWPNGAGPVRPPRAASPCPYRRAGVGRWSAPTPGPTSTASCAGAPNAAGSWSSSGCGWPWRSSWSVGSSVAPGPTTAGKGALGAAHDRLLAQPLSATRSLARTRWRAAPSNAGMGCCTSTMSTATRSGSSAEPTPPAAPVHGGSWGGSLARAIIAPLCGHSSGGPCLIGCDHEQGAAGAYRGCPSHRGPGRADRDRGVAATRTPVRLNDLDGTQPAHGSGRPVAPALLLRGACTVH